ncbi:MAG: sigma-70 family RNA polymerase sigma factor [Kofleriaceae bacterium]
MTDDLAGSFEPYRRFLAGLAYRMLGSIAEAEDVVQDAFLRWSHADRGGVIEPRAFLSRIVTRLCLDRLKSARVQREEYVGTWLPEPVVEGADQHAALSLADDLSVALLVTLESLSPLERAAFLLHDVFDMEFSEVAGMLERSEPAVRQLAARARDHVKEGTPRFEPSPHQAEIVDAFHAAITRGDLASLAGLLAEDAVFYSDGGGKRRAALRPIYGRAKILRFFTGIAIKNGRLPDPASLERATINSLPGFLVHTPEGTETLSIAIVADKIVAVYAVRNPDKLRHLS